MKKILIVVITLLLMAVTGCADPAKPLNGDKDNNQVIMTSFYPIYIMTINITHGVPGIRVVNLTPPQTGCLHDYQLKPSDVKQLATAKVLVINGANMESFIDKVRSQYPKLKVVTASEGADLLPGGKSGEVNPHLWVSISGAIYEVEKIAQGLAATDPGHADQYQANAQQYIDKLKKQQAKMQAALGDVSNRNIVTFHEAFPYFAREFDLKIVSVVEREPGAEPSAAELAATIEQVKKSGTKALFAEPQYSSKAATVISQETGARVYILDPVVTGPNHPDAYLRAMDKNLSVLKEALH